jgi:hypothetical protein
MYIEDFSLKVGEKNLPFYSNAKNSEALFAEFFRRKLSFFRYISRHVHAFHEIQKFFKK